ncbi:MAG: PepSY-associated TM helix domain-containing protein [Acidobacteriota bacterium]|nr:PepSY-associated TM helix domain-containing protein [Acidobacteriota bacterium]
MSFNVLNRKVHYWIGFGAALPVLVMILSGLLLQAKKQSTWVQPAEMRGTGSSPVIDFEAILAAVKTVPGMNVQSWDDVNRMDVRIARGVAKVWLMNGYEVQVDTGTGAVLQTAYRRSDIIESIHDGSFFGGDWTKLGIFLPAGIVVLLLWISGMWMWWVPYAGKRRIRRARVQP